MTHIYLLPHIKRIHKSKGIQTSYTMNQSVLAPRLFNFNADKNFISWLNDNNHNEDFYVFHTLCQQNYSLSLL